MSNSRDCCFPFGEAWVEENTNAQRTPYHFTSKELDEETGLYYFGARYYDPRTSVWQSADPILSDYINGEQGMGGVFNSRNLALYAYSHNNPVALSDPDGNEPNKAQAITWDQAKQIISKHTKTPTLENLKYTSGEATGKKVGPFGGDKGGRYIWTKKQGWIDLGHFFQVAAEGNKKLGGSSTKKALASTVGRGYVNSKLLEKTIEVEDSQGPGSAWSYEDPSSNKAGSDFLLDYFSGNDTLIENLNAYMKDVGASDPSSAPNWKTMQEKAQNGLRYEKAPRNLQPVLNPRLKKAEE